MRNTMKAALGVGTVVVLTIGVLAADEGGADHDAERQAGAATTLASAEAPAPSAGGESAASLAPAASEIVVYKSPTCGCCSRWVDHVRAQGFAVVARDTSDMSAIKRRLGVPSALESCHTAMIDGYVVEGHVPAADIARLLETRPSVAGLAVPGMPMGSPGMEGPRADRYDVVTYDQAGRTAVFSSH